MFHYVTKIYVCTIQYIYIFSIKINKKTRILFLIQEIYNCQELNEKEEMFLNFSRGH